MGHGNVPKIEETPLQITPHTYTGHIGNAEVRDNTLWMDKPLGMMGTYFRIGDK